MRITELFGQQDAVNYSVDWADHDPDHVVADFKVGDKNYRFNAYQDPYEAPDGDWEVEFESLDPLPAGVSPYGITGAGRSAEVFSTVVNIIRNFIRKRNKSIRRLRFGAKEGSRQDLYARMVKRLLPDWTFDQDGPSFVLTRPGLTWWVYSVEPPYNKIKPIEIKAPSADKAKEIVMNDPNSPFKGADSKGMVAGANKPRR